jgi:hypothetical protein
MNLTPIYLFNDKVDRLDRCRLAKRMETPHYQLEYEKMVERNWVAADGVTEDDVDAFALNLRLLIQDKDGFSFRQLFNNIYSQKEVPNDLRIRFEKEINTWDEYQEMSSIFSRPKGEGNYLNKELFEILFYGGIAHMNVEKVQLFYSMTKQGGYSAFLFGAFLSILRFMLNILRNMRQINKELLEKLKNIISK